MTPEEGLRPWTEDEARRFFVLPVVSNWQPAWALIEALDAERAKVARLRGALAELAGFVDGLVSAETDPPTAYILALAALDAKEE